MAPSRADPPSPPAPSIGAALAAGGGHLVLSRRYRPARFGELVGQAHVAQTLTHAIESGRIGHAYLFVGPRGTGKTTTARIFAKALNCVRGPTPEPCGACDSCVGIAKGNDLDVVEMDAASNNGVDDVRALRDSVGYRPARSRFRIWIVDEVHMLSLAAFNAFLKTLEEPPPGAKFLFCTTEAHKLPETFLSRVQRLELRRIDADRIADRLAALAAKEGLSLEDGVASRIAAGALGGLRDAESLLEQLLSCARDDRVTLADLDAVSGRADARAVATLLAAVLSGEAGAALDAASACVAGGAKPDVVLDQAVESLRALLGLAARRRTAAPPPDPATAPDEARAVAFGLPRLARSLDLLLEKRRHLRDGADGRLVLELAAVELARLPSARDLDAVLAALARPATPGEAPPPSRPVVRAPVAATGPVRTDVSDLVGAPPGPSAGAPGCAIAAAGLGSERGTPSLEDVAAAWPAVIASVERRSRRLGSAVARSRVTGVGADTVVLALPAGDAVARAALRERDAAEGVREATREILGVGLRPVLDDVADPAPAPARTGSPPPPASARPAGGPGPGAAPGGSGPSASSVATLDEVRALPTVKAVLDAFGARVLAVQRTDVPTNGGAASPGPAAGA